jgi:LemA protein
MSTISWVILAIIAIVAIALISMYNGLIRLKNRVEEAFSDMDVQMKRRYDLIPNLVESVRAYAKHEEGTLEKVIKARNDAMNAHKGTDFKEQIATENMLSSTLKSLFALSENYPDLKANQNFLELQRELTDTEDKIMSSRRFYNGNVRDFNTKLQVFPTNILGKMLGFMNMSYFELADEKQRENVQVKF